MNRRGIVKFITGLPLFAKAAAIPAAPQPSLASISAPIMAGNMYAPSLGFTAARRAALEQGFLHHKITVHQELAPHTFRPNRKKSLDRDLKRAKSFARHTKMRLQGERNCKKWLEQNLLEELKAQFREMAGVEWTPDWSFPSDENASGVPVRLGP